MLCGNIPINKNQSLNGYNHKKLNRNGRKMTQKRNKKIRLHIN